MRMKNKYFFFFPSTFEFSCLKVSFCHRSTWSLFPECPGKGSAARERMEKQSAHPFLGYSNGTEKSLWLNRATSKFWQINFLPVVKMPTSSDGVDLKGNKQGNCIFYCWCINFVVWNMNSLSAAALGAVWVRVQAPGAGEDRCVLVCRSGAEEGRHPSDQFAQHSRSRGA